MSRRMRRVIVIRFAKCAQYNIIFTEWYRSYMKIHSVHSCVIQTYTLLVIQDICASTLCFDLLGIHEREN